MTKEDTPRLGPSVIKVTRVIRVSKGNHSLVFPRGEEDSRLSGSCQIAKNPLYCFPMCQSLVVIKLGYLSQSVGNVRPHRGGYVE